MQGTTRALACAAALASGATTALAAALPAVPVTVAEAHAAPVQAPPVQNTATQTTQDEASGPPPLPAGEAWRAAGKTETVCGQVVDTAWQAATPHAITYLYVDRPRPEQVFTVMIPAGKRDLFGDSPEKSLRGKHLCVTGKIQSDNARPANGAPHRASMVVEEEDQLTLR